jgi:hypothetical protein
MVEAVRGGESQRSVARRVGVSLLTVQRWLTRAANEDIETVDWSDRSSAPHRQARQIPTEVEDLIVESRRRLRDESVLGEYGAAAVWRDLAERAALGQGIPSVRTIGRTFARRGTLDAGRRVRRPAPPPGWYLPGLASGSVELDSFDTIEGLRLKGGQDIEILTGISIHGGLPGAWPARPYTARMVVAALTEHWLAHGLPAYAQFDNGLIFHGTHGYPDRVGRVSRLCLGLGVVPVFVPPYEPGFQAAIESLNGRWQAKLWRRTYSETLVALKLQSERYIEACRVRSAVRIESAPARSAVPAEWVFDVNRELGGRLVYIRRTNERGEARLLGRRFEIDPLWPHRLVRAELDLTGGLIRFYALRRRDPTDQPLLRESVYAMPPHRLTD